jgi:uncharacterized protein YdaU (DUF1376 family)
MSETPYIPFYTSDFLGGTGGMTAATKGVYITLLCLMYEADGPLTQQYDTLARRCGCTLPAFKRAVQALEDDGKVVVLDDGLWSQKCEKHVAQRRERRRSATSAAKTRWEKTKEKQGEADKAAMRKACQPEPEPEKEERAKALSKKEPPEPSPFEILTDVVSPEVASDFLAHRKAMRKPVTARAAKLIAKKIRDHPNPNAVLNESIANGWQGVFPERYRPRLQPINGGQHGQAPSKSQLRLDAFVSGAAKTS